MLEDENVEDENLTVQQEDSAEDVSSDSKNKESKFENFKTKFFNFVDKGVSASKKGLKKAGTAISETGTKSVHKVEIANLNSKFNDSCEKLGNVVYEKFKEGKTVSSSDSEISEIYGKLDSIKAEIAKHEEIIKSIGAEKSEPKDAE